MECGGVCVNDSILATIRKAVGLDVSDTCFDTDLIMHINSVFSILAQLGCGPHEGFSIEDDVATWSDYLSNDATLKMVQTYVSIKVKLAFDPPASSVLLQSYERTASELEWRINVAADTDWSASEKVEDYEGRNFR